MPGACSNGDRADRQVPSAPQQKVRSRVQGDGSAWLHSPQVAIAACLLAASAGASTSREVIAHSCPCEEETDTQRTFSGPGPLTTWVLPGHYLEWDADRVPLGAWEMSRPWSSRSPACPWNHPGVCLPASQSVDTGGACFG